MHPHHGRSLQALHPPAVAGSRPEPVTLIVESSTSSAAHAAGSTEVTKGAALAGSPVAAGPPEPDALMVCVPTITRIASASITMTRVDVRILFITNPPSCRTLPAG